MESVSWDVRARGFSRNRLSEGKSRVVKIFPRKKLVVAKRSDEVEGRFAFCNTLNILSAGLTSSP